MKVLLPAVAIVLAAAPMWGAESTSGPAAEAINALGVDLLRLSSKPDVNCLLSPYSIQSALAMTYSGSAGATRDEMMKVLHYPKDEGELHRSFSSLQKNLADLMQDSAKYVELSKTHGRAVDPLVLTVANRLFGQTGYDFRAPFLALLKDQYDAPLELVDYIKNAAQVAKQINNWVEEQTRQRIRDLIPGDALTDQTRLVLVNAVYLKAPWSDPFFVESTQPAPFQVGGKTSVDVPTMNKKVPAGYAQRDGFAAITLPYQGSGLQFLILLPDKADGLPELEKRLQSGLLAKNASLPPQEIILHLPKFKIEPPLFRLSQELQRLGMKSAFDVPPGSANFDRMAPRRPNDYLYLSEVFHKTFLNLDERGTEAAAATAAVMMRATSMGKMPVDVKVDRPFLFAIQHRESGACLFLGHVVDPR